MAAAPNAQSRALSGLCVGVALGDSGEYWAERATAQDPVVEGHLAGLDHGNGCYFDSLAADALVRLGRWTEVAGLLARHPLPDTLPVGRLQLAMEKRPLHFDISSADRARERSHLVSLGASIVQEFEQHTWMRGPEGNDFCLTDA